MKPIRAAVLALAAAAISLSAHAQTDRATAEVLMRDSGLWSTLAAAESQMEVRGSARMAQAKMSPDEIERFNSAIKAAFAARRLQTIAEDVIEKETNPTDVPALLAWYEGPTGKAMTKLEEDSAAQTSDPAAVLREGSALFKSLPETRQTMLTQFAEATKGAEALARMTISMTISAQTSFAAGDPTRPTVSADELRKAVEAQLPRLLKAFSAAMLCSVTVTYADVPDAELAKYLAFLQSAAGAGFNDVSLRALNAAMVDAGAELGRYVRAVRETSRS